MKRRDDAHSLGHKFGRLLRGRTLPDAECAGGASAYARGECNGGIDENAAGADRGLELLEQSGLALEGYGENEKICGGAGGGIFHARNASLIPDYFLDVVGGFLCAVCVARADDYGFSGARPAQGDADACRTGSTQDGNGTRGVAHANSGSSVSSAVNSSSGSLSLRRV